MARILNLALSFAALCGGAGYATSAVSAETGDAGRGKMVFAKNCSICHTAIKGGPTILGPNLFGVVGRQAGSLKGFNYSPAMKAVGYAWTPDKLANYLPNPTKTIPGIRMTFAGLKDPVQLQDLIAYLKTLK